MFSVRRYVVALTMSALVLAGAGIAYAGGAFEGAGNGPTDDAGRGGLTVHIDPAGVQGLYPGATTMVGFRIKNDGQHPVSLRSARPFGFAVDAAHAGCLSTSRVVTGSQVVLHGNLAAGAWSPKHQVQIAMGKRAGDSCRGARFTFRLDVVAGNVDV